MRVPLSWLRDYVDVPVPAAELADVLTAGGLAVEAVHRPRAHVSGVRVVEVAGMRPVPDSDTLTLVAAFDGERTHQIVCGAANYAVGDRVPAALPGATLAGPDGPVVIASKRLRGVESHGMLASPRELAVGDDHRGIWVLDADAPVGADLVEWLGLDEQILELEVTPDRGYALSMWGVARDVAALTGAQLHLPAEPAPPEAGPGVPVRIDDPDRCLRFVEHTLRGVRVGPSPAWLQRRLVDAGMRPLANVVDATNHAMLETGNPVHAYDVATLAGPRIEVRTARPGEKLRTLDGVERALVSDDLVIADADAPVGLAGVMGGEATEIGAATTDVLVETATFSARTVLRTARRHQLLTQGSARWEKTVPPESAPLAAARCVELIQATAGGQLVGAADHYPAPVHRPTIRLRPQRARSLLGVDLDDARQRALLERIACAVTPADGALAVAPPYWRPDLTIEADLAEELARLYGYDRFGERVPSSGASGGRSPAHRARIVVRRALAGGGWTEVLCAPFIAEPQLADLGWVPDDPRRRPVMLVNPLSSQESVLRTTLIPGMLHVVRHNVNHRSVDLALYEVGHVFWRPTRDEPGADGGQEGTVLPAEPLMLGLAACGDFRPRRYDQPARGADLYDLLGAADLVRAVLGRDELRIEPTGEAPYHPGRAARLWLGDALLGTAGQLHPRVAGLYEVPAGTLVGELRLDRLVAAGIPTPHAALPSSLPGLRLDVAVVVGTDVPAAAVRAAVVAGAGPQLTECTLFDVYTGAQLGEGRKSLAYALRLDDPERQLTDAVADAVIAAVQRAVAAQVGGHLRR